MWGWGHPPFGLLNAGGKGRVEGGWEPGFWEEMWVFCGLSGGSVSFWGVEKGAWNGQEICVGAGYAFVQYLRYP